MVHIKRLEMRGFKSFGSRKISISLENGLTVFTGPNGSGKSNVFDAIRFVLGDLSARSLRASKMSEVIFDGGGGKKSKTARVKLHFDNKDRMIPLDEDVVTLSRMVNSQGFSKYFLNTRSVSRSHLLDILSMAGIHSSGYNMIMQGTITKLADITPEERRRVIEDSVGIAEYNTKKAEARGQLRQAETNLKIADARIGDVQYRLERLEEERNDALRYNFLRSEIRDLQAILISQRIYENEAERRDHSSELQKMRSGMEEIKTRISELQNRRREVESDRRRFDEELTDNRRAGLRRVQEKIGGMMADIAGLRMEIDSGKSRLQGLKRLREKRVQQLKSLEEDMRESTERLSRLKRDRENLRRELDERELKNDELLESLFELKQSMGDSTSTIKELDSELKELEAKALRTEGLLKTNDVEQMIISDNLNSLEDRRSSFEQTLKDLEEHLSQLNFMREEEKERFSILPRLLENSLNRKKHLVTEMEEAEKTVKEARKAIVEFRARKDFLEEGAFEDPSLRRMLEMGEAGAIPGITGLIQDLVEFDDGYERALQAAASGWLKALVVEDLEAALKCVESLRRMRLGRIKLIPLKEVKDLPAGHPPSLKGVIGLASELVECDDSIRGAVNYVFGGTVVAAGGRTALQTSLTGFRVVDLNGSLYEAEGGIESGYYRPPIDIQSLIPSDVAMEGLSKGVQSLERMLSKRKKEVEEIDKDALDLRESRIKQLDLINMISKDIDLVSVNLDRTRQNLKEVNERILKFNTSLDERKDAKSELRSQRSSYLESIRELRSRKEELEPEIEQSKTSQYEEERKNIESELARLNKKLLKLESDVDSLKTSLRITLKPEYERVELDIENLTEQITQVDGSIKKAQLGLREAEERLSGLEEAKEDLSLSWETVKAKRSEFEDELDDLGRALKSSRREYDASSNLIHQFDLKLQRKDLELESLMNDLLKLGHEDPVSVDATDLKEVGSSLGLMKSELEQLGSVNQLSPKQYAEQQKRYKQLSVRRNQLEGEREAILDFIEEIERKKRDAFMDAFNQVNDSFGAFFEKLTGGGEGYLSLENDEDPFSGGLDIFVQFPGKSSRLIAGASGGEKSVVAVAFIFSIQSLTPASFYMFDEIDAHLDPYNAERLADLLKEQSGKSQFIVVTLRDVTIDRAEQLFGVYIQNGVSKIVSARMEEKLAPIV